ncbi:acyl-CoA synthetase (AMP-forming)/AMP-acid ligase II [Jatrophihabitans sp. GAS493]|uniref:AMP-binding protein n=1 Tax=Jatrophihabitans sp. GAS493 TaxID=1907575 RepID=UPI000BBF8DC8|nr:AMP-binding protein [Jatrophihabitans sp. GAS493]SOD71456.1 acyl-CoA synthetase (AMP-forming)/AMP-acid ligase II [Jatrophihabitans sp. GAS493]
MTTHLNAIGGGRQRGGSLRANGSLRDIIRWQRARRPASSYLEDARSDRSLSYAALERIVECWSLVLARRDGEPSRGAGPAQEPADPLAAQPRIALLIDDPLVFAAVYLSVIAAGCTVAPIDAGVPAAELRRIIDRPAADAPNLLITDQRGLDAVAGCQIVTVDSEEQGLPPDELILRSRLGARSRPAAAGALRLSTSGSTGQPKVVELGEAQLLHVARQVAAHNELSDADRGFCSLPLFHINAQVVGLLSTLVSGATMVLDRRFHRTGFWDLMQAREITWINAVPAILSILSREDFPPPLPKLRLIRSASAPLPSSVRTTIETSLQVPLVESYGMTEAASQITATPLHDRARPGSAGRAVGVELSVRTGTGECAATDEVGRIWIRGPGVITGYVGGRAAERFDPAGWLDTGDLGLLDADGYVYLRGRADDVINRGGELIHPREIQEILLADRRVLEAIVVGRPDPVLGAVAVARVITAPSCRTELERAALLADLDQLCRTRLSRFKRPEAVEIVDDLPRAATGKIRTHLVRELVCHGRL